MTPMTERPTPDLRDALRRLGLDHGWTTEEAREVLTDFFNELQPRLGDLTTDEILALFRERYLKVDERHG